MLDTLSIYLGLTPLAVYLMLIGMMNMSRRPFVVSGVRDLAVVLLAISGLVVVGPMELFFPVNASWHWGIYVWVYLLILYALIVCLILLGQRPRLNIYSVTLSELRPILSDLAMELDETARWAGDALCLPKLGVQFYLESNSKLANVSLISYGLRQSTEGWRILQNALTRALNQSKNMEHKRSLGIFFFLGGLLLFGFLHGMIWYNSATFLQAIPNFLRV
ncbi:MAG: hypothetical protein Q4D62_09450 [Planctomycetia bacterium]|nr:hypothetical protein [Planctomycetia bacterium]